MCSSFELYLNSKYTRFDYSFYIWWKFLNEQLLAEQHRNFRYDSNGFVCSCHCFKERVIELLHTKSHTQTHILHGVFCTIRLIFPIGKTGAFKLSTTYNLLIFLVQFRYRLHSLSCTIEAFYLSLWLCLCINVSIGSIFHCYASQSQLLKSEARLHAKLVHLTY